MKRFGSIFFITTLIIISTFQLVYAHPNKQSSIINWGEDIGWDINETYHTNGTQIYYKFNSGVSNSYKTIARNGANLWGDYAEIDEDNSAIGTLSTKSAPNEPGIAWLEGYYSDNSGHLTQWKIVMNTTKNVSDKAMAHEFGHVFGLKDLRQDINEDKLMYGYINGSADSPTDSDVWGFKVITGDHTDHNWSYTPTSKAKHKKYCFQCEGYKTESCTFTNGKCQYCGRKK